MTTAVAIEMGTMTTAVAIEMGTMTTAVAIEMGVTTAVALICRWKIKFFSGAHEHLVSMQR